MTATLLHATAVAVALDAAGDLHGALLLGPSGGGKSDLALRLVDGCPFGRARLIADDQVVLTVEGERVVLSAPAPLRGLLEVRGVGLVPVEPAAPTPLAALFDLDRTPDRLPEPARRPVAPGLPEAVVFALHPFEASAPARVRAALRSFLSGQSREAAHHIGPN